MQGGGNLVGYARSQSDGGIFGTFLASGTNGQYGATYGATAIMQGDGNLFIYTTDQRSGPRARAAPTGRRSSCRAIATLSSTTPAARTFGIRARAAPKGTDMKSPKILALAVAIGVMLAACGRDGSPQTVTPRADAADLARVQNASRSTNEVVSRIGPELRDVAELSPAVLYDVPDGTPVDDTGKQRTEWQRADYHPDTVFIEGTISRVERGMRYRWLPESAPRDPKYGDGVPAPCTSKDNACTTAHLYVDVIRSYPDGAATGTVKLGAVSRTDFETFASGMLALGRVVVVAKPNWALFAYDESLRTVDLDQGLLYRVETDGQLLLPLANEELGRQSRASAPTSDRLFDLIAKPRTIRLRYSTHAATLERDD
jgi:hypothetical protein